MISMNVLIIIGAILANPLNVLADPVPTIPQNSSIQICKDIVQRGAEMFGNCYLQNVRRNESLEHLLGITKCRGCEEPCRNLPSFLNCLREFAAGMPESTKSRNMGPFLVDSVETGFSYLCRNNTEMFNVLYDNQIEKGLVKIAEDCRRNLTNMLSLYHGYDKWEILFCDLENEVDDPINPENMCRLIEDYLVCMEKDAKELPAEASNFLTGALNSLRSSAPCATYFPKN